MYLLGSNGNEAWTSFLWEDNTEKEEPAKVLNKFEGILQTQHNGVTEKRPITLSSKKIT